MKNKGFFIVWYIFIAFAILDILTTYMNYEYLPYTETNPLFGFFGALWPIVLLNVVYISVFYFIYNREKTGMSVRFLFLSCMLMVIFIRIFAIYSAITWVSSDITVEQAAVAFNDEIRNEQFSWILLLYFIPVAFAQIVFFFWFMDHKVKKLSNDNSISIKVGK